jgi:putative peptidoglycan lipid II flippase
MLSHSIIAISIATPYFTRMSTAARDGDLGALRSDLSASLRLIGMLVAGAGAALAAAALPFAAFFDPDSARITAVVLLGFLVGLVPFSSLYLVLRAFYALGDTRTPFVLQIVQAVLFIAGALGLLLAPSPWIAAGIALATSLSVIVQALGAAILLRRRLGGGGATLTRRFGVFALATLPAAAVGVAVLWAMGGFADGGFAIAGRLEGFVTTVIVGGSGILTFLLVLIATRAPELTGVISLITRRATRRQPE